MRDLSWNVRLVLGMLLLAILFIVAFFIYYTLVRLDRDKALEFETYPGAQLIVEETLTEGYDHFYFTSTDPATEIEDFYAKQGYQCTRHTVDLYEDTVFKENAYYQSNCFLDRSHSLGFTQFNAIIIQPQRTPWQDPPSAGGGALTGLVVIDIQRQWGGGFLGG
jgi:hypothetical protein